MMSDILLNDEFEFLLDDAGDLVTDETADQETECLLWEQKGERREAPTSGFGIVRWLKSTAGGRVIDNVQRFKRELQVELAADGKSGTVSLNADLSQFKIELNG